HRGLVRREGRRLRAGRIEPAQLHERTRARRGELREGDAGRTETREAVEHARVHVRNALRVPADAVRDRDRRAPTRVLRVLARPRKAFQAVTKAGSGLMTSVFSTAAGRVAGVHGRAL